MCFCGSHLLAPNSQSGNQRCHVNSASCSRWLAVLCCPTMSTGIGLKCVSPLSSHGQLSTWLHNRVCLWPYMSVTATLNEYSSPLDSALCTQEDGFFGGNCICDYSRGDKVQSESEKKLLKSGFLNERGSINSLKPWPLLLAAFPVTCTVAPVLWLCNETLTQELPLVLYLRSHASNTCMGWAPSYQGQNILKSCIYMDSSRPAFYMCVCLVLL